MTIFLIKYINSYLKKIKIMAENKKSHNTKGGKQ